ncbi:MAG: UvrD-helicase domain-containing protein [Nitrospirota bacterium]
MNISRLFNDLNESQKKAVMTTEGPLLIVAGPGTGKTLTIAHRIAYLINNKNIKPENILAVTFTNRAAREMRKRTEDLLGRDAGRVFIGTFHLLGLRIIKDTYPDTFIIYNREEQINLVRGLIKDADLKKILKEGKGLSLRVIVEKISRIKNLMEDADDRIKTIFEEYQAVLTKNGFLDFDDLILKPLEILSNTEMQIKYRDIFRYIMVDEYQDINTAQYKLLMMLAQGEGKLCAIGDSDQAIYAFRGADVGNFLSFENDFKAAEIITLTENYRSTGIIINASGSLIKNNLKRIAKEIRPVREKGISITMISVPDEKTEGEIIVREIEERIGGTSHYQLMKKADYTHNLENSCSFSDFAVIYRTNAQAKAIEESFKTSGIPYQIIGEKYHLRRREITNILSFLKAVVNPVDDMHFHRMPDLLPEKLSEVQLETFKDLKDKSPVDEFLKVVWEESCIRKYYSEEILMLLSDLATQYHNAKPEEAIDIFINEVSLLTPADDFDSRADAVTLMTLHMAKGLEFKVVFIAGVEEGLIPCTIKKEDVDIEEERRLFYVGMTRAMDELFLMHSRSRFLYGQRLTQSPSPFLREISDDLVRSIFVPDRVKKHHKDKQIGLF